MKLPRRPSVAIEGARALRSFVAIRDILHASLNASDPEEVFQFSLERISPLVDATFSSIYLMDGSSDLLRLVAAYNWPERFRAQLADVRVRVPFGPSGRAASERRLVRVDDVHADPELHDWHEVAAELGFNAIVAIPLVANSNVLGVLTFYFAKAVRVGDDAVELMQVAADQLAAFAEKAELSNALRRTRASLSEAEAERDRLSG